jgi:hypothetical protein
LSISEYLQPLWRYFSIKSFFEHKWVPSTSVTSYYKLNSLKIFSKVFILKGLSLSIVKTQALQLHLGWQRGWLTMTLLPFLLLEEQTTDSRRQSLLSLSVFTYGLCLQSLEKGDKSHLWQMECHVLSGSGLSGPIDGLIFVNCGLLFSSPFYLWLCLHINYFCVHRVFKRLLKI